MRKLRWVLIVVSALLCASVAHSQDVPAAAKTQEAAAAQALAILRLVAEDRTRDLGFAPGDLDRATLGSPLGVYDVDLAALKQYRAGADASALLEQSPTAFYPVLLDGAVRSGVRVENTGQGWEAARVGNSGLAISVDRARHALPAPDDPGTALVQVLALNLVFVGQKTPAGWILAPAVDDASVGLKVGTAEPASDVFARLAPIAERHNGEPT